jgi:UDP-glucose:(heptosyl)LPS alpha-1,3-glucosyltransferase
MSDSKHNASQMPIIHVVRRYGPVGGMELYAWKLTHQLRDLGHNVVVICQICIADKPHGITVHELGVITMRPRWLSSLRFSSRLSHWLVKHPHPQHLIHSHERINCHHVTTFHGPPFASVFEKSWWHLISLRVWMQLFIEKRELSTPQYVVPNSQIIKQCLSHYYPKLAYKLTHPILPGVENVTQRMPRNVPSDGGVVGFVGYEWKRKGLAFAVEILEDLRQTRPQLQFIVIGPAPAEIAHLFKLWQGGHQLLGWVKQAHYADFDVLLHPAKAEPYGMVISEAMAAGVPVVVSDACGAAHQITQDAGTVLALSSPIEDWVEAINQQLSRNEPAPKFSRSWKQVALEYVEIYNQCSIKKTS